MLPYGQRHGDLPVEAYAVVPGTKFLVRLEGHSFAIFVITVAAAEAAVGLAIVICIYRNARNINVDDINLLKW